MSGPPINFKGDADCKHTYNSMKVVKQGGSGFGSLVHLAKQHGYRGPVNISGAVGGAATNDDIAAAVEEINACFAMITGGSNAGRIADLTKPSDPVYIERHRFDQVFANKKLNVVTDKKSKLIAKSTLWLNSSYRREHTDIVFEPPGSKRKVKRTEYNRFQGFAVRPEQGNSHGPLLAHIFENVCGGNTERYEWLIAWFADLVQAPGNKPGTAVVLRGEQGAGKTIIVEYFCKVFGPYALKLAQQDQITGKFNSHLAWAILVAIEEGFWAGDKAAESVLKDLITSPTLTTEMKYASVTTSSNHTHILVTANADWVVPAGIGDRRWAVFGVSSQRAHDNKCWGPIWEALNADGPAHLLHFLLNHKYERSNLFRPPMTKARLDQIEHSLNTVEAWWLDVLKDNHRVVNSPSIGEQQEDFGSEVDKLSVFNSYLAWFEKHRTRSRPVSNTHVWKRIRALTADSLSERRPGSGFSRQRLVRLPSREHCQSVFATAVGCDWADLEDNHGD